MENFNLKKTDKETYKWFYNLSYSLLWETLINYRLPEKQRNGYNLKGNSNLQPFSHWKTSLAEVAGDAEQVI